MKKKKGYTGPLVQCTPFCFWAEALCLVCKGERSFLVVQLDR